eukprot:141342_1
MSQPKRGGHHVNQLHTHKNKATSPSKPPLSIRNGSRSHNTLKIHPSNQSTSTQNTIHSTKFQTALHPNQTPTLNASKKRSRPMNDDQSGPQFKKRKTAPHKYQYINAVITPTDIHMQTQKRNTVHIQNDAELLQIHEEHMAASKKQMIVERTKIDKALQHHKHIISSINKRYQAMFDGLLVLTLIFNKTWSGTKINDFGHFITWLNALATDFNWHYIKYKAMNKRKEGDKFKIFIRINTPETDVNKLTEDAQHLVANYNNTTFKRGCTSRRHCGSKSRVVLRDRLHSLLNVYAVHNVPISFYHDDVDVGVDYFKCAMNDTRFLLDLKEQGGDEERMEDDTPQQDIISSQGIDIQRVERNGRPRQTLKVTIVKPDIHKHGSDALH